MELTKTKLHKIIKRYNSILEQHNKNWSDICKKASLKNTENEFWTPNIYEYQEHTSKGQGYFQNLMEELNKYEVFPANTKSK